MRAALLPTPGDPFMLAYWLRNYATWREYVDELVVFVNGLPEGPELEYDRRIVEEAGGRFIWQARSAGHDGALRTLLDATIAEHVMLCEDDAYVRKPIAVGAAFADIEQGRTDIVGSPRHEDYFGQWQEWGPFDPKDQAEFRHGLWPAFLFIERKHLLETDRAFGDQRWDIGDWIAGLDRVVTAEDCAYVGVSPEFVHLDTLFGTTFQLRAKGLRTELVHHVRLYDAKATEEWLAEDPPWFHITGLSTLQDALSDRDLPDMDEHGGLWTRRVAWWWRTADDTFGLDWDKRQGLLSNFEKRAGMTDDAIESWLERFARWDPVLAPA